MHQFNITDLKRVAVLSPPSKAIPQLNKQTVFLPHGEVGPFQLNWFATSASPSLPPFFRPSRKCMHFQWHQIKASHLYGWGGSSEIEAPSALQSPRRDALAGGNKKARPRTVKTDPLIFCFCRRFEIEEENTVLVCRVTAFQQGPERQR